MYESLQFTNRTIFPGFQFPRLIKCAGIKNSRIDIDQSGNLEGDQKLERDSMHVFYEYRQSCDELIAINVTNEEKGGS